MKASNNYLALRDVEGTYYVNGNWRIDFPSDYEAAGSIIHYERKVKGGGKRARLLTMFAPEQIRILGPITEPLYVVVSNKVGSLTGDSESFLVKYGLKLY